MRTDLRSLTSSAFWLLPIGALLLAGCDGEEMANTTGSGGSGTGSDAGSGSGKGSSGSNGSTSSTGGSGSSSSGGEVTCSEPQSGKAVATRAIIFVWDGMRPDVINAVDTPNLNKLREEGVFFEDNHSTYPTFTMMNSASFATGSFPGTTGFYGNTFWANGAMGNDSAAKPVDFVQPVFTEDYAVLTDLDTFYQGQLLLVGTLFQAAQAKGLKTATIGKTGAAFLQDIKRGGIILDEKMVWPLSFAKELQAANVPLPLLTTNAYNAGDITLDPANGDPTKFGAKKVLSDNVTSDASDASGSPFSASNKYMMDIYLSHVLPEKKPDLSVIWMRNPDSTQHNYGPGSPNFRLAIHDQDALLGDLQAKLADLGLVETTNLIIVSDHSHSNVAGPAKLFPLRAINGAAVGQPDPEKGFSVSGDVRLADLLTRGGFTNVFDGAGCFFTPVMSGMKADGSPVYPVLTDDATGTVCGTAGANKPYTTKSYKVPATQPPGSVIIAANGGSEYIYVPDHDKVKVGAIVSFLQSREEFGAIFVASMYGAVPGTIPLNTIKVENTAGRSPDIIVSYTFDETAKVQGLPGIEFESMSNSSNRGMHGSFSPIDVHNTLLAIGPDFRSAFQDTLPTGNVDVAPTVAFLLGLTMPQADGRPLYEALSSGVEPGKYAINQDTITSSEATGLTMKLPTDPDGKDIDVGKSSYRINLYTKTVSLCDKQHTYFDFARAVRQ